MGTVPINLPLIRTAELQLSMSFSNLAVPAVGGMAAQIRFLQKQGVDLASAVASGGLLINVGNIVAQVLLLGVALAARADEDPHRTHRHAEARDARAPGRDRRDRGRRRSRPRHPEAPEGGDAADQERRPRRCGQRSARRAGSPCCSAGNAINALMYAAVYWACIEAFGGSINFWTLLSLNIIISTFASLVPDPRRQHRGVVGRHVGRARRRRVSPPRSRSRRCSPTSSSPASSPRCPGWWATNDLLHDDYL